MAGFFEDLGQGLQNAGAVLSPDVYRAQNQERRESLDNFVKGFQIRKLQREMQADDKFSQAVSGLQPDAMKDSTSMLEALKVVPMDVIAESPKAQTALKMVSSLQQREALQEQRRQGMEFKYAQLDQQRQIAEERSSDARASAEERARANLAREQIMSTMAQLRADMVRFQTRAGGDKPLGDNPDFWYEYYDKTGKLPPMAWGAAGNPTREQFLKGFPEWKSSHGGGASDTAASQATFKANAGALNAVTKDLNTFEPYKKMLDTNADIAIQLGKKIYQTDSKLANRPLNWLRQNASSNPDVAEYMAQMRFVQTEAARVINNPRIVGQLTDEARKEMDLVISGNAPIPVVERVLNRLKTDGSNRFNAMRGQQQELISRMKGEEAKPEPPQAPKDDLKSAAEQAWHAYEPDKYDYRMKDGKVQRKAKSG